jgi:hypothetical protein
MEDVRRVLGPALVEELLAAIAPLPALQAVEWSRTASGAPYPSAASQERLHDALIATHGMLAVRLGQALALQATSPGARLPAAAPLPVQPASPAADNRRTSSAAPPSDPPVSSSVAALVATLSAADRAAIIAALGATPAAPPPAPRAPETETEWVAAALRESIPVGPDAALVAGLTLKVLRDGPTAVALSNSMAASVRDAITAMRAEMPELFALLIAPQAPSFRASFAACPAALECLDDRIQY